MVGAFKQHPNFRTALLPSFTPSPLRDLVGALPGDLLNLVGTGVGFGPGDIKVATAGLRQDLEALVLMLQNSPYLLGDQPTLADFAVAAATMYLKFPTAQYVELPEGIGGKGVPGIADVPEYRAFFDWRDRLYAEFRTVRTNVPPASSSGGPTSISID
jgi:glutathione S-transferase